MIKHVLTLLVIGTLLVSTPSMTTILARAQDDDSIQPEVPGPTALEFAKAVMSLSQQLILQIRISILTNHAQSFALAFDYDSAIATMNTAIDIAPDSPELYRLRGQIVLLTYEWDAVLADYNIAIDLDPTYPDPYFHRGVLFYTQGPRERALPDFEHYLELAPDGPFADKAAQYLKDIGVELDALRE